MMMIMFTPLFTLLFGFSNKHSHRYDPEMLPPLLELDVQDYDPNYEYLPSERAEMQAKVQCVNVLCLYLLDYLFASSCFYLRLFPK